MAGRADQLDRFRWAACQLDVLSGCLSLGKLRHTLDSLPETLDETYDRILCKIDPLFKREVLHILQWLTCSLRPLSLDEVAEVVAFDVDSDDKFNDENRLAEPEDVLNICSSLVISIETDSDDNEVVNNEPDSDDDLKDHNSDNVPASSTSKARVTMVRLAHFSVKEYLVSDRIRIGSAAFFSVDEEASNAMIGATGLSCLQLYDEALFPSSKDFSTEFPLARYSAKFWHDHFSAINNTAQPSIAPDLFLSEERMRNWIALYDLDSHVGDTEELGENALGSPLYYAALTGLKSLVEALIKLQKNKDSQVEATNDRKPKRPDTDDDSTTLQYMSKDAFINATGGVLHTPLQAASWSGRREVVELLINHGADPNIYGGCGSGSALSAAAHKGFLDIIKLLLDKGANLYEGLLSETSGGLKENRLGSSDAKSLPDEAIDRHTEQDLNVMNRRMERLAEDEKSYRDVINPSIDTYDRRALEQCRRTALYGAASFGDAEIARLMLDRDEHGAIINLRNNNRGETALSRATSDGHDAVVQILLQRGALVNKTDTQGGTALMAACKSGNESIARKLLDKGADPNCTGQHRGTPMIDAIRHDDEIMVRLLLEKGALVDVAEKNAGSPLRAAVVRGLEPIVRLLIDHGANVDQYYPLIEAVRRGYNDIAKLLVEKGADVNAAQGFDHEDGVPFWLYTLPTTSCLAEMKRSLYGLSKLCLRPKNRRPSKRQGYVWEDNPLWVAAALGDEESVKLLLDNGANPKVQGACAMTPLEMATFEEHEAVVQLLLAAEEDSNSEINITEDNEPGDSAEVEIPTPPPFSDLDDISEASQEDFDPSQPSQALDNSDTENPQPQDTQPLDKSTDLSPTQQQPKSPPDSPTSPPHSSHPSQKRNIIVIRFTDNTEHTIDLDKMLLRAKNLAKTNGFKRFGQFGDMFPNETFMQNPCVMGLKMMDPDNMSGMGSAKSSDEEEDDGQEEDDEEDDQDEEDEEDGQEDEVEEGE